MRLLILLLISILALTACVDETPKTWETLDGSKSDGTVTLGYQHTSNEIPVTTEQQGLDKALSVCQSWGFSSVSAFDLQEHTCVRGFYYYGFHCTATRVLRKYQCNVE